MPTINLLIGVAAWIGVALCVRGAHRRGPGAFLDTYNPVVVLLALIGLFAFAALATEGLGAHGWIQGWIHNLRCLKKEKGCPGG